MIQIPIPFLFLRGGTSRGPYFLKSDLPDDPDQLSKVLLSVIGSRNPLNIDGLGGGNAVTTKVAILSKSEDPAADVDYFFAQVSAEDELVDYKPTCGNILVGVGPAAIEFGLVEAGDDRTTVRICAVNTGALIHAEIETPNGCVEYTGDFAIDGVPGTAAPVALNFFGVVGSQTDAMFPTGEALEKIDGIEVTCIDVTVPMMVARAADFGLTGYETPQELDANTTLMQRLENLRLDAGRRMGMGDVAKSVVPKVGLVAPARDGGHMTARYFMPWACHPSLAVTGSQCLAACILAPGTVIGDIANPVDPSPSTIRIEHPMGEMSVRATYEQGANGFAFISAGVTRTARLIARGEAMVPASIFKSKNDE